VDMLHSVLLGVFKCLLSIFCEMLGCKSQKAMAIDALAKVHCHEFACRSDQSLLQGHTHGSGLEVNTGVRHLDWLGDMVKHCNVSLS
jgi:hypothetical protein